MLGAEFQETARDADPAGNREHTRSGGNPDAGRLTGSTILGRDSLGPLRILLAYTGVRNQAPEASFDRGTFAPA